jgi:hypothetical protein
VSHGGYAVNVLSWSIGNDTLFPPPDAARQTKTRMKTKLKKRGGISIDLDTGTQYSIIGGVMWTQFRAAIVAAVCTDGVDVPGVCSPLPQPSNAAATAVGDTGANGKGGNRHEGGGGVVNATLFDFQQPVPLTPAQIALFPPMRIVVGSDDTATMANSDHDATASGGQVTLEMPAYRYMGEVAPGLYVLLVTDFPIPFLMINASVRRRVRISRACALLVLHAHISHNHCATLSTYLLLQTLQSWYVVWDSGLHRIGFATPDTEKCKAVAAQTTAVAAAARGNDDGGGGDEMSKRPQRVRRLLGGKRAFVRRVRRRM